MDRSGLTETNTVVRRVYVHRNTVQLRVIVIIIIVLIIAVPTIYLLHHNSGSSSEGPHLEDYLEISTKPPAPEVVRTTHLRPFHPANIDGSPRWLAKMGKKMDMSHLPCASFYERACRGWERSHPLPTGENILDEFTGLSRTIFQEIKTEIETSNLNGEAEQKVKKYFNSCNNLKREDRNRILQRIKLLITPMKIKSLQDNIEEVHSHNAWPLFHWSVRPNPQNVKEQRITMYSGESPITTLYEKETEKRINIPTIDEAKKEAERLEKLDEGDEIDSETKDAVNELKDILSLSSPSTMERAKDHIRIGRDIQDTSESLTSSSAKRLVKLNLKYNELIFKYIFGMSDTTYNSGYCAISGTCLKSEAQRAAQSLFEWEIKLFKAMTKNKKKKYGVQSYDVLSLSDLQQSCSMINWMAYIKQLTGSKVMNVSEIIVYGKENLISVCNFIETELKSYSGTRNAKYYVQISFVKSLIKYFDIGLLLDYSLWKHTDDQDFKRNHWWRCMAYDEEILGLATSSIFVSSSPYTNSTSQVKTILDYVKRAFRLKILQKPWIDSTTEKAAIKKLDSMIDKVGYPPYIMNQTFRDNYYSELYVTADYFSNVIAGQKFLVNQMWIDLSNPSDRSKWTLVPSDVNAQHSMTLNDMTVPLAIIRPPFFDPERPIELNFGALGAVIGHELTHAFGTRGQYYDFEGARKNWMSTSSEKIMIEKAKCFVDQYDTYKLHGYKFRANLTLDENIADNGGLRAAYEAYKLWKQDTASKTSYNEFVYRRYNLTEEELFFTSFSQMYCSRYSSKGLIAYASKVHSPGPLRVRGSLSNMQQFSSAFSCSSYNRYNPTKKCVVW